MGGTPGLVAAGNLSTALGGTITTTRASTRECTQTDGGLTSLNNNIPCVEAAGLVVEPGVTNLALQSGTMSLSPWAGDTNSAVSTDTMALWRMDDDGGTTVNATGTQTLTKYGAGTSGTVTGSVLYGRSLQTNAVFLSSGALTQANVNALSTGAWTISGWVRPAGDNGGDLFINNGLNFGTTDADLILINIFYDNTNHRLQFNHWTAHGAGTTNSFANNSVPASSWTFVALSRTAPNAGSVIYNGRTNNVAQGPWTSTAPSVTNPANNHYWGIGAYTTNAGVGNPSSPGFHADVDDVRVFTAALSSAELDAIYAAGNTSITATANASGARDGTTTAVKLDFPVVSARQKSIWTQTFTGTAAIYTAAVDVKAVSGTPTLYLSLNNGGTYYRSTCSPTTSSLTRCSVTSSANLTAATWTFAVGVDTADSSQSAQAAQSVYVSESQVEASGAATSYVPTTGSTAARSADQVKTSASVTLGATPSYSADVTLAALPSATALISQAYNSATDKWSAWVTSTGALRCEYTGSVAKGVTSSATLTAGTKARVRCYYDGNKIAACVNEVCTTSALVFDGGTSFSNVFLGSDNGSGSFLNGKLSAFCLDTSAYGCH